MVENVNKHPKFVKGYSGSLLELAQAMGKMSYDQLAVLVDALAKDLATQAQADLELRGRKKLAKNLIAAADHLNKAKASIDLAWQICEPYMPKA